MRVKLVVENEDELERKMKLIAERMNAVVEAATEAGAQVWQAESNRLAPGPHVVYRTKTATLTRAEIEIGPDKAHWYYQFFETGAGAHDIPKKKRKKAIAFDVGSERIIRMSAKHPGMAASPFLRPPATEKRAAIIAAMRDRFYDEIVKITG